MFALFQRRGTAPRRYPDAALFAAIKVLSTIAVVGTVALILLAPIRTHSARDADLVAFGEFPRRYGDSWFDLQLTLRVAAACLAGLLAGAFAARRAWAATPLTDVVGVPHHDDSSLHYGDYASRRMQEELDSTYGSSSKRGIRFSPGITVPFEAENQFILVVGDKGSGKSNVVRALAAQMVERGDRVLLHCVKGDVTQSFRPAEAVLIGAHHAHSWAWDVGADMIGMAGFMELAAAAIPMSDTPFWALTARAVFVDIAQELVMERGTDWDFNDLTRRILSDPADIERRIRTLDLSASPLISEGPDGLNNTTFGVMATLWSGALNTLRPLAFAWEKVPPARRFSVRAWVSDEWTGPRTVILQTSPEYAELSRLVSGTFLSRLVNLVSDPALAIDADRRVCLVLDELHSLGRIEGFDRLLALGREKGLVVIGAVQSLTQLTTIYGPDVGAVVQDLFRFRIFSALSAGRSAETAADLIGHRTIAWWKRNNAPASDDKRKWIEQKDTRPIIPPATLQGTLGVKVIEQTKAGQRAHKEVRAVVSGLKDVYRIDWPLTRWPKRRAGYVPAQWLTAPRRLAKASANSSRPKSTS